ncbi:MAG TPA: glycerol-3-phosphate responsive antiterminator [Atribacteraceae bacterium]|nr:glycerol-3-phosphate responsive antiterminator [Atribacteraceae bacterium]
MSSLLNVLGGKPVIGAIRPGTLPGLSPDLLSLPQVFFLLEQDINALDMTLKALPINSASVFLHLDLLTGLSADQSGIRFLRNIYPSLLGVISTRTRVLELARKVGFMTILRLFLLDSESLASGMKIVSRLQPDALEILPGIIFPGIKDLFVIDRIPPLICGGFIRSPQEVRTIIQAGARAVSTSATELWILNREEQLG